jgi:divinyl chlorophyllide a 8-vinyl-reductase
MRFVVSQMLFKSVDKEPKFLSAPLWLFDVIIDSLQWVADTFKSEQFEDAAESARIGKYYAVEPMLTTDPSEKFGTTTIQDHYNRIALEGQDSDPYMSMRLTKVYQLWYNFAGASDIQ